MAGTRPWACDRGCVRDRGRSWVPAGVHRRTDNHRVGADWYCVGGAAVGRAAAVASHLDRGVDRECRHGCARVDRSVDRERKHARSGRRRVAASFSRCILRRRFRARDGRGQVRSRGWRAVHHHQCHSGRRHVVCRCGSTVEPVRHSLVRLVVRRCTRRDPGRAGTIDHGRQDLVARRSLARRRLRSCCNQRGVRHLCATARSRRPPDRICHVPRGDRGGRGRRSSRSRRSWC